MICWCGIGDEDDNKKMWEILRTIMLASCQNRISVSQDAHCTRAEFSFVWVQVAGVSYCCAHCKR
jgi:hypothetical protein